MRETEVWFRVDRPVHGGDRGEMADLLLIMLLRLMFFFVSLASLPDRIALGTLRNNPICVCLLLLQIGMKTKLYCHVQDVF